MSNNFKSDYCPFCGSKDYEVMDNDEDFYIQCTNCKSGTGLHSFSNQAMDAWENRVKLDPSNFRVLENKIIAWANDKNLLHLENSPKQLEKVKEELKEFEVEFEKNDLHKMTDELGDVVVTLIILATQLDLKLEDCLLFAYHKIKNRTGRTVNGTFIKDSK